LSSYYLVILACLAPRLCRPTAAALALFVLVLLPQLIAWLASDVPGPASYATISLLFVVAGVAFLVGALRPRPIHFFWKTRS
jgi:cation transporter-like permease